MMGVGTRKVIGNIPSQHVYFFSFLTFKKLEMAAFIRGTVTKTV
jgi:hypothetical protein